MRNLISQPYIFMVCIHRISVSAFSHLSIRTAKHSTGYTYSSIYNFSSRRPFAPIVRMKSTKTATDSQFESLEKTVTEDGVYVVKSMPPPLPDLKYDYYLLRHGQSEGNVEGVISSARSLATSEKHGLTPLGQEQSRESSKSLLQFLQDRNDRRKSDEDTNSTSNGRLFFYSSPFARARQTAQCCIDGLIESEKTIQDLQLDLQKDIIIEDGIMERFFGELDDKELSTYAYVWPVDMEDVTNTGYNVESVAAICTRMYETLEKIDTHPRHEEGDVIVLVSHADTLQILQVYAAGLENVGEFSSYRFTNGEVRELGRSVDILPDPQPLEIPEDLPILK